MTDLDNIDWQLFEKQKDYIAALARLYPAGSPDWDLIEGILDLMDAVQDTHHPRNGD